MARVGRFFQSLGRSGRQVQPMTHHLQTIHRFYDHLSRSDIAGALALMTDDVVWHNAGKPELIRSAGDFDKTALGRLFQRMIDRLTSGLQLRVVASIAEGDRVAVEAESSGDLRSGRRYRQQYHSVFVFRGEAIAEVREYLDTLHAHDVWFRE